MIDRGNNLPVLVEAQLNGLTVGNTYHFRLVATTGSGTVSSPDRLFTVTLAPPPPDCPNNQLRAENRSTDLPECRAYEMVSAPNKSSADAALQDYTRRRQVGGVTTIVGQIDQSGQGKIGFPEPLRDQPGRLRLADDKHLNGPSGSLYTGPEALRNAAGATPADYSADLQKSVWLTFPGSPGPEAGNRPYLRNEKGSSLRSAGPRGPWG